MYNVNIEINFEQCSLDKELIDVVIPYAVVHFITAGEGYFNGRQLHAGQFFAVNKNQKMSYCPSAENPWSYFYVRIYGEESMRVMEECGFGKDIFVGTYDNEGYIEQLYSLYHNILLKHPGNQVITKAAADIFILLFKPEEHFGSGRATLPERHVYEIVSYIDTNYYKKLTMESLSKRFFLSRAYMRNIFCKYMGISPKRYLQQVRIQRACELLRETNVSISEVAHSVGYDDSLRFSAFFSKYKGLSPSAYRKNTK